MKRLYTIMHWLFGPSPEEIACEVELRATERLLDMLPNEKLGVWLCVDCHALTRRPTRLGECAVCASASMMEVEVRPRKKRSIIVPLDASSIQRDPGRRS